LLQNLVDKTKLTKEFKIDKSIKVDEFIKNEFNPNIIMIHEGNIINEEKTFEENNLISYEKQYEIYYFEKKRENFSENGYIVRNYAILEKIGKGGFGKVYRVIDISSLKEYALKEIEISPNNREQVENEIRLLSQLRHKYIVKYYESFQINNFCYILMELCSNKNLFDLTRDTKKDNQILEENFIWEFFLKICIGVGYLHKNHVIHRDLKTSNIFLTKNGNIKIGDLGISKLLETTNMQMQTSNGTPYYSAPEL
jgi:NIMA (never in mitosis gene a)-related kinase